MNLASKEMCTRCGACTSACSSDAISLQMTKEGFFYPVIDRKKCVCCYKCEKVCPENKKTNIMFSNKSKNTTTVYASMSSNLTTRMKSSSGGIFTELFKWIYKNGGVVFGAGYDPNFHVEHSYVENERDIEKFQTSKYVQSFIHPKVYQDVKKFLDDGRWVLFSGTSCQIAGLYEFLGKAYAKLITVDFICSGNTSPGLWDKYLRYLKKKYTSEIEHINFRDKKYSWDRFCLSVCFSNGKQYYRILPNDPWAWFFLNHEALRECCFHCRYKENTHGTDFTLGDFWGVQYRYKDLYDDKGLSLVMTHTNKGRRIWHEVAAGTVSREIPLKVVEQHNTAIVKSPWKPNDRDDFLEDYKKMEFAELEKKYTHIKAWKKSNILYDCYWRIRLFLGGVYRTIIGKV